MSQEEREHLISLNRQLLEAIATSDWQTYQRLCDPILSAFEREARGHLIEGLQFHKY